MLSHPAIRLHELLADFSTVRDNILEHQQLHSLIKKCRLFAGIIFDVGA